MLDMLCRDISSREDRREAIRRRGSKEGTLRRREARKVSVAAGRRKIVRPSLPQGRVSRLIGGASDCRSVDGPQAVRRRTFDRRQRFDAAGKPVGRGGAGHSGCGGKGRPLRRRTSAFLPSPTPDPFDVLVLHLALFLVRVRLTYFLPVTGRNRRLLSQLDRVSPGRQVGATGRSALPTRPAGRRVDAHGGPSRRAPRHVVRRLPFSSQEPQLDRVHAASTGSSKPKPTAPLPSNLST